MRNYNWTAGVLACAGLMCLGGWLVAQEQPDQPKKPREKVDIKREVDPERRTVVRDVPQAMTYIARSAAITGMPVRNKQGEDLGELHEMVIDLKTGRIRYAVLQHGGVLGIGDKLFAIPWEAFTYIDSEGDEADYFVLNVPRQRLDNAPGFDQDNWPDFADPKWSKEVETHYQTPQATRPNGATRRE